MRALPSELGDQRLQKATQRPASPSTGTNSCGRYRCDARLSVRLRRRPLQGVAEVRASSCAAFEPAASRPRPRFPFCRSMVRRGRPFESVRGPPRPLEVRQRPGLAPAPWPAGDRPVLDLSTIFPPSGSEDDQLISCLRENPPFPAGFLLGGTDLERTCKCRVLNWRGGHRRVHRTNTSEQLGAIDLPIVDQRVRVPIRGDQLRPLSHELTDFGPRPSLLVKKRDPSVLFPWND